LLVHDKVLYAYTGPVELGLPGDAAVYISEVSGTGAGGAAVVRYTDGREDMLALRPGADGAVGVAGRGVEPTATTVVPASGDVVFQYGDGATETVRLGRGPTGVGIAGITGTTFRVFVDLTDGRQFDVPLPETLFEACTGAAMDPTVHATRLEGPAVPAGGVQLPNGVYEGTRKLVVYAYTDAVPVRLLGSFYSKYDNVHTERTLPRGGMLEMVWCSPPKGYWDCLV
jgi:hypothetical protein